MSEAAGYLRERLCPERPAVAMILGSGLGDLVGRVAVDARAPFAVIPGFPQSAVSGHAGEVVSGRLGGKRVLIVSGRVHYYENGNAAAMRPVIEAIAGLGIGKLCLTNAAGSVREDMAPGAVMAIEDHIAFSGMNPLIGETSEARFTGMTAAYDPDLRAGLARAAKSLGEPIEAGVYMWFSGPSFETPAEIRMARTLGADAVGMSTVPETILARFFGLRVVAASVITNFAAGMTGGELSHAETKAMAPKGGARLSRIVETMLAEGVFDD